MHAHNSLNLILPNGLVIQVKSQDSNKCNKFQYKINMICHSLGGLSSLFWIVINSRIYPTFLQKTLNNIISSFVFYLFGPSHTLHCVFSLFLPLSSPRPFLPLRLFHLLPQPQAPLLASQMSCGDVLAL